MNKTTRRSSAATRWRSLWACVAAGMACLSAQATTSSSPWQAAFDSTFVPMGRTKQLGEGIREGHVCMGALGPKKNCPNPGVWLTVISRPSDKVRILKLTAQTATASIAQYGVLNKGVPAADLLPTLSLSDCEKVPHFYLDVLYTAPDPMQLDRLTLLADSDTAFDTTDVRAQEVYDRYRNGAVVNETAHVWVKTQDVPGLRSFATATEATVAMIGRHDYANISGQRVIWTQQNFRDMFRVYDKLVERLQTMPADDCRP